MARKLRIARRVAPYPPDWWQYQNLYGHGIEPVTGDGPVTEDSYQRIPRRGFETLADMEAYWTVHRERLLAEYGTDNVVEWWAFLTWG